MENSKTSGRTAGDTAIEILSNWRLIGMLLATALTAFVFVVKDAEPGTVVEVFGIKYQRAKPSLLAAPVTNPNSDFLLPQKVEMTHTQANAIPIIDGALAIQAEPHRDEDSVIFGGSLIGPNINKIKVAARTIDGRPVELSRGDSASAAVFFPLDSYVEIEYAGKHFSVTNQQVDVRKMIVSVALLKSATLDLLSVDKLQHAGTSE